MSLQMKDFEADTESKKNLLGRRDVYYKGLDTAVASMNAWLEDNPVEVITVETVTLPNIHSDEEEGTVDTELSATGYALWYQFVRLWYRAP
jgi:hypothetical protein